MNIWDWRVTSTFGGALWGGWALYVNWEAGLASASLSAATQAVVSASSITLLSLLANWVLARRWRNVAAQMSAAAMIPWLVLLSLVVSSHLIVQTHDILRTILPSASIGIAYSWLYAFKNHGRFASSEAVRREATEIA